MYCDMPHEEATAADLRRHFTEVHPLPGRSLLPLVADGEGDGERRAVYLQTRDNMLEGDSGASALARRLKRDAKPPLPLRISVPAHVGSNFEGVVAHVPEADAPGGAGHLWKLVPLAPRLYALRMDDELDFASASVLERAITEHLAAHPDVHHVCLFAQPINRIDATGVEMFIQLRSTLAERGVTLHISGIKLPVETVLRKAGALGDSPLLRMYRTDIEALAALSALGDAPAA